LKKLEQLSEELLAVRGENTHLALQLKVCFGLREINMEKKEGGQ
jgi:hypothetical protein